MKEKTFKTYDEQLGLLKNRGLSFADEDFALTKLQEENYYNIINGYKDLFIDKEKDLEFYIEGVTFEEIYSLYDFDRNIRNILFKYILKVENNLRSLIAYSFSEKYGNDNYLKFSNFETLHGKTNNPSNLIKRANHIQKLIANLQSDIAQAVEKKDYIKHYIITYGFVPLWVLVNCITLGRLSQFYTLMEQSDRAKIAIYWNVQDGDLRQYIKLLADYRNLCAHDERIYNSKKEGFQIPNTKYHGMLNLIDEDGKCSHGKNDFFALIIVMKTLLSPTEFRSLYNKVNGRLESLQKKITNIPIEKIYNEMGLSKNWRQIKSS